MRYGYFDDARREYIIDRADVPVSWTNYLGTQDMAAVVSHHSGGYCFYKSPQHHRVTRFRPNGVQMDSPGFYVYLRDDLAGNYWSVGCQPIFSADAKYQCRHGLSYTTYHCAAHGIEAEQTVFIPRDSDDLLIDVKIKNTSETIRELSVYGYVEFSFHQIDMDNQNFQMSLYAAGSHFEDNACVCELHYEEDSYQFYTTDQPCDGFEATREAFIGAYHTERDPIGIERGELTGSHMLGGNPVGALRRKIILAPGEEVRVLYMLGQGRGDSARRAQQTWTFENVDRAFADLAKWWDVKLNRLQVQTPHRNMNTSLNIWNLYQSEINVLFSRFASFIEVGGRTGLGYRDTAQDAMCIPAAEPEGCRWRIMQLLNGLTEKGYGLHLFDPAWFNKDRKEQSFVSPTVVPTPDKESMIHGIEHACADDALWLVGAICEYIRETGDLAFADLMAPYAEGTEGTVFEHIERILQFSAEQVGINGVCKGLRADWNDCLNLGGGESAMVSFLHLWALNEAIDLCEALGREAKAAHYREMATHVQNVCQDVLWDGKWFLRGFTRKGDKIGTDAHADGKVHMESNTWAVISGAADTAQALSAMDSVDEYLYTPYGLMLNAPSFVTPNDDLGFVARVYSGVKENGSVFSHPNPWAWVAECMLGRGSRAMKFYDALLPQNQNDLIQIRKCEPYSYCQFIMGKAHTAHGRANHPWMTGSAGWAYFAATHYMLGIRPDYNRLIVDPCIPAEWDGFTAQREFRGVNYEIAVENPDHVEKGVAALYVDGERADHIPVCAPGSIVNVRVVMGA